MLLGKQILVVEDEALVALDIETEMANLGAKVITATSVDDALCFIESAHLDGATVDVKLRGERTFKIADALPARHIPFVFATALLHEAAPASYADIPWLEKPIKAETVCRTLDTVMCLPQDQY